MNHARLALRPLFALGLGYFLVMFDVTSINVAVPRIEQSLGSGTAGGQWVVDTYSTVFAALLLLGGGLGERFGHRRIFLIGLELFAIASVLCAAAPDIAVLVAGRLAQGAGGALLVPCSLSLLASVYTDRGERARAVGAWAGISGIAFALGPVLGGFLVAGVGWRAVFWLNLPFAALAVVMTVRHLDTPRRAEPAGAVDVRGQLLAITGLACVAGALNEAATLGWGSPLVPAILVLGVLILAAFVVTERRLERRGRRPLLAPSLFRGSGFAAAATIGMLLNLGFYGLLFLIPVYFQQQRGYDALTTGFLMLPAVGMALFASPLSGRITARYGSFRPMVAFLLLGGAGFVGWLATGPATPYFITFWPLALTGLAAPLVVTAVTAAMIESVPVEKAGIASAVLMTARQIGNTIGVALFGTLAATSSNVLAGLHLSAVVAAASFALGAALAYRAGRQVAIVAAAGAGSGESCPTPSGSTRKVQRYATPSPATKTENNA
ncbi:MFS transporter [Actinoallomurus rhizosphaericola]|uniref:MFS transporter n=1 Tax=Actinoallomurus rhizosphaericola TaxID=2952536 RepID=UPI002091D8BA|nr:MFS transporter [Actinoallomurus rhizosphaericola]MCO5994300.1 MFS transporter [Actinoallomurus rhizosphaericola]